MNDVKRGEVMQGQAHIHTAAAFAVAFAVIAIVRWLIRQAIMAKSHTNAVRFRTDEM
ncbi:hypothetical protein [Caballeronia udeis]|uniref:hypothetical protein n=1 Tax=Caballeronia udeis TaxID=1232866 RepID=UPI0012E6FD3F|nr:hypothetical protein [Caballeronia udeis]